MQTLACLAIASVSHHQIRWLPLTLHFHLLPHFPTGPHHLWLSWREVPLPLPQTLKRLLFQQTQFSYHVDRKAHNTEYIVGQAWARHTHSLQAQDTTHNEQCMDFRVWSYQSTIHIMHRQWVNRMKQIANMVSCTHTAHNPPHHTFSSADDTDSWQHTLDVS